MDLEKLFNPKTIAIIGASRDPTSVGQGILKNLLKGCVFVSEYCKPFKGRIYPVNPNADSILDQRAYPSIKDIDDEIDLAIIAIPSKLILPVIKECIVQKVGSIIIVSAGFAEHDEKGKELQDEIITLTKQAKIPVIGPNCLGIIRPSNNLNASFAPSMPPQGNIAFVSQSGAIADSIIDWAIDKRYGFSNLISYGNGADLRIQDFLEYLAKDEQTKAITLYIEGIEDGRKFIEVAKKISKIKPIVALKAGRTEQGKQAIATHTGSLAGTYEIYKAAFKQSGIILADTIEELFDTAKALAEQPPAKENSIAIITNGGGCGVLTADYCAELGVNLVELTTATIKKLDNTKLMSPNYSKRNPLDIIGDALPEQYEAALNTLLAENYIHGVIVIQTLQTMTDPKANARVIIEAEKKYPNKPILCVHMGGKFSQTGIKLLEANNIPNYNDLRKAALAMKALIERGKQN